MPENLIGERTSAEVACGIVCPRCECPNTMVTHTRRNARMVRRRRQCEDCGKAFWTIERTSSDDASKRIHA
jgi:hypothetical protein